MPLFRRFSQKSAPVRKASSLSSLNHFDLNNDDPIQLSLGEDVMTYTDGKWMISSDDNKKSGKFQQQIEHLKISKAEVHEENNLLKLKNELLLDMLAKSTAQADIQQSEIRELKNLLKRKK